MPNQQGRTTKYFAEATYSQINDINIDNEPDITRYSPNGNTDTTIIACVNYGTIIAAYYNGGILGKANGKTDIMGCANFGNVYLVESDAATTGCGGISSDFLGRYISCYNWGEVSASG